MYENIPSPYSPNICMLIHEVMVNVLSHIFNFSKQCKHCYIISFVMLN